MRQIESRPVLAPRPSSIAVALMFGAALLAGCGPRELPAEARAPSPAVIAPPPAAPEPAPPASTESVSNATVTATIQGDPFAQVDLAADDRLRQILRVSDKPRAPEGKAAQPAAPRVPNPAPARSAEPAEPVRTVAPLDQPPPTAVFSPVAAPVADVPPAAPAVAASTAPAEPPSAPVLRAIERGQPPFPADAQREGIRTGRIVAAITVLPNGSVSQVDIVESTPARVFDRAVRNTLLRWRFEPVPQQVRANVEILFNGE